MDFDYGLLQELANEAPMAGFANVNYGRVSLTAQVVTWESDSNGKRTAIKSDYTGGKVPDGAYLELTFSIDVTELNAKMEFPFSRRVNMKRSGPRVKTEWSEIVLPSLEATFGKDWAKALTKSPYVEVEDNVDMAVPSKKDGKLYGCPKFLRTFKSKAACEQARAERFRKSNSNGSAPDEVPADVLSGVQALLKVKGITQEQIMEAIASEYPDYDASKLYSLAKG